MNADLLKLIATLKAIEAADATKAPVCRELLAKLSRYATDAPEGRAA